MRAQRALCASLWRKLDKTSVQGGTSSRLQMALVDFMQTMISNIVSQMCRVPGVFLLPLLSSGPRQCWQA